MPIRQYFHCSVPSERLVLAILRYRHELPNTADLTSRSRVPVMRRPGELTTLHRVRWSPGAGECEPGCRQGERGDVAESNHRRPPVLFGLYRMPAELVAQRRDHLGAEGLLLAGAQAREQRQRDDWRRHVEAHRLLHRPAPLA